LVATVIHMQSPHSSQYRDTEQSKGINKFGQQWMPRAKEIFPRATGSTPLF
jgi:hypothetical protein